MSGPEKDHDANDAALLFDVAEGAFLGSAVIAIKGIAEAGLYAHTEIGQNSQFYTLHPADQAEFLTSAIAKLQVMLDEVR